MDDDLKHLKESMDRTILKEGIFRPDEKKKILRTIEQQKQKKRRRKRRLMLGIPIAVSFVLLIGLSWIAYSVFQDNGNRVASESSVVKKNTAIKESKQSMDNNQVVKPVDKNKIETFKAMPKYDDGPEIPYDAYVVLNDYYYKETGDMVDKDKLGQKIGSVQQSGEETVNRSGNSNGGQSGAIYAIHGKDPAIYIAVKGSVYRNGKVEVGYLIFKKFEPVKQ